MFYPDMRPEFRVIRRAVHMYIQPRVGTVHSVQLVVCHLQIDGYSSRWSCARNEKLVLDIIPKDEEEKDDDVDDENDDGSEEYDERGVFWPLIAIEQVLPGGSQRENGCL